MLRLITLALLPLSMALPFDFFSSSSDNDGSFGFRPPHHSICLKPYPTYTLTGSASPIDGSSAGMMPSGYPFKRNLEDYEDHPRHHPTAYPTASGGLPLPTAAPTAFPGWFQERSAEGFQPGENQFGGPRKRDEHHHYSFSYGSRTYAPTVTHPTAFPTASGSGRPTGAL